MMQRTRAASDTHNQKANKEPPAKPTAQRTDSCANRNRSEQHANTAWDASKYRCARARNQSNDGCIDETIGEMLRCVRLSRGRT